MKKAVKKMKLILLAFQWRRYWRCFIAITKSGGGGSTRFDMRRWSFDDRLCLYDCLDDGKCSDENFSVERLRRTTSYIGCEDDDVDRRAEIFISNFHSWLRLERQVSLKLSYFQENNGSSIGDEGNSLF